MSHHDIAAVESFTGHYSLDNRSDIARCAGSPTATTLTSSPNPKRVGQAVTFTATVSSSAGIPPNGEIITFNNGSAVLGSAPLSGGATSLAVSSLPVGTFTITARYPGDANFVASTSPGLKQVVNPVGKFATSTSLTSSLNPSIYGTVQLTPYIYCCAAGIVV